MTRDQLHGYSFTDARDRMIGGEREDARCSRREREIQQEARAATDIRLRTQHVRDVGVSRRIMTMDA